jgi:Rrf2 family protein
MLTTLRRAQILRSIRGPRGGYQLARPPAEIPLLQVITALEGEVAPRSGSERASAEFDALSALEERLEASRRSILEGTSVQDLLDQRNQLASAQAMYFI